MFAVAPRKFNLRRKPRPIVLSDISITQIMQVCRPLSTADRDCFLELLAARLDGKREVADGEVYRIVREL